MGLLEASLFAKCLQPHKGVELVGRFVGSSVCRLVGGWLGGLVGWCVVAGWLGGWVGWLVGQHRLATGITVAIYGTPAKRRAKGRQARKQTSRPDLVASETGETYPWEGGTPRFLFPGKTGGMKSPLPQKVEDLFSCQFKQSSHAPLRFAATRVPHLHLERGHT